MTSLEAETAPAPNLGQVEQALAHGLSRAFGVEVTTERGIAVGHIPDFTLDPGVTTA